MHIHFRHLVPPSGDTNGPFFVILCIGLWSILLSFGVFLLYVLVIVRRNACGRRLPFASARCGYSVAPASPESIRRF
ncbi:hypothetical protein QR680_016219 [Steinernema hermaphroditum]|uniref:Uncharacterized protein n=1 Tax=Steinernema hermaphroditum TaxID=289476 RepID=A0AA39HBK4_9BILA|nr:hypothetical protein QR680_016219 [Steinernema hermaphroditum]